MQITNMDFTIFFWRFNASQLFSKEYGWCWLFMRTDEDGIRVDYSNSLIFIGFGSIEWSGFLMRKYSCAVKNVILTKHEGGGWKRRQMFNLSFIYESHKGNQLHFFFFKYLFVFLDSVEKFVLCWLCDSWKMIDSYFKNVMCILHWT